MKRIGLCLMLLLCSALSSATTGVFTLSGEVYQNGTQTFIRHHGSGRFGNYLAMNVNYSPIEKLFAQLVDNKRKLKSRGEAHITVLTPLEYYDVLRKKLTIAQIDKIALAHNIQSSPFEVVCLGRGEKNLKGRKEETFFVVVKSEALLKIRKAIQSLYIQQGGAASDFDPALFYPHITIGFSARDLHLADGVVKDKLSCFAPIEQQ